MSEMRTYECWVYDLGCRADMVSKPEADAVIEAQNTKIIQLTALIENCDRISGEIIDNANHQKYKRCLLMAKICENKLGTVVKPKWWDKWRKRWLELANRFKAVQNSNLQKSLRRCKNDALCR